MEERTEVLKDGRSLTIRLAQAEDAEAVVRHVNAVSGETDNFSFGEGEFEGTAEDLVDDIQAALEKPNYLFLLAWIGEELVGLISFTGGKRQRNEHVGDLSISVREKFWGLGIGQALMQALIEWAQASHLIRKINLTARADNLAAIRLYERVGFVNVGTRTRNLFINGEFVDCCWMEMDIDPIESAEKRGDA